MDLRERLGWWASGAAGTEAAIELLIETDYWLDRREFLDEAVVRSGDDAAIDWSIAARLADELVCSRGERFVLRLACSLANPEFRVAMADVSSLDGRNLRVVQDVLRTAKFGWPDEAADEAELL